MLSFIGTVLAAEIEKVDDVATLRGLEGVFDNAISVVLGLGGIVFFILLVAGGFQFITSGGEPPKIEQARKTLTYAITGIVLLALAFLILKFISTFTGINVTQFKIFRGY